MLYFLSSAMDSDLKGVPTKPLNNLRGISNRDIDG